MPIGQMLEAEAEDNSSRPKPRTKLWPRGQHVLEDLTSLAGTRVMKDGFDPKKLPLDPNVLLLC